MKVHMPEKSIAPKYVGAVKSPMAIATKLTYRFCLWAKNHH